MKKITKEVFYNEIKRLYEEHGKVNINIFKEYNTINVKDFRYQVNKYGGIKKIFEELGLEYRLYNQIPKEDTLNDLKRVLEEHGTITKSIYEEHGKYSNQSIMSEYKSWNDVRKMLGLDIYERNIPKEEVLNDILEVCRYNTSSSHYRRFGKYSNMVTDRLGGWVALLEELGLKPKNKKVGVEYMKDEVSKLYEQFSFISRELVTDNCDFSYQAISHALGGKRGINKFFGKDVFNKSRESSNSLTIKNVLISEFGEDDIEQEFTWGWLVNDKTGYHLYADYYIKSLNAVVEYDGEQHFRFIKWFHKTIEKFKEQQYRDNLKNKLLNEHKVNIVRFSYLDELSYDNIAERVKEIKLLEVTNL